ncbi:MAG: type II secretion system F family protein, partial [Elusimicrobiaceae bacterium]|nr:type II secretion system F family protein [Elusimicrobiaceae bacterium]
MYFFEILSLSLESGNNLYNAIKITSENVNSELSEEFKKMMIDIKYSKSFDEAIND